MESIYTLFAHVTEHPDFAGGTIWTREDVADAIFTPDEGWDEVPDSATAAVTDDMLRQSQGILEAYIFEGGYSWREALKDNIEIPAA